jgi:hypothetical protein
MMDECAAMVECSLARERCCYSPEEVTILIGTSLLTIQFRACSCHVSLNINARRINNPLFNLLFCIGVKFGIILYRKSQF